MGRAVCDYDIRYNISALAVYILRQDINTPEEAFKAIEGGRKKLTDADTVEMIRLRKEGKTYKEIGKMYGITFNGVWQRINAYMEKENIVKKEKDYKKTFTDDQLEEMLVLREEGKKFKEIAKAYKAPLSTTMGAIKRYQRRKGVLK